MEGSRWGSLRVYAQANGILNYTSLNLNEPVDRVREQLLLHEAGKHRRLKISSLVRDLYLFVGTPESIEKAQELSKDMIEALIPDLKDQQAGVTISKDEAESLRETWEKTFGSMDSPHVKQTLQKLQEELDNKLPDAPTAATWLSGG